MSLKTALLLSKVGGTLSENLSSIKGKLTFPDPYAYGKPEQPVIVNVGFQDLLIKQVKGLSETLWQPYKNGN